MTILGINRDHNHEDDDFSDIAGPLPRLAKPRVPDEAEISLSPKPSAPTPAVVTAIDVPEDVLRALGRPALTDQESGGDHFHIFAMVVSQDVV